VLFRSALIALLVFLLTFFTWRYVSLGSIAAALSFPIAYTIAALALHWPLTHQQLPLLLFAILVAALIIYKHRSNISRLRAGTEQPMKRRASSAPSPSPPYSGERAG